MTPDLSEAHEFSPGAKRYITRLFTPTFDLFRLVLPQQRKLPPQYHDHYQPPTIFQHEDFFPHLYYRHMPGFTISGKCHPSFHQGPLTCGYLSSPKYEYVPILSYFSNVSEIVLYQLGRF